MTTYKTYSFYHHRTFLIIYCFITFVVIYTKLDDGRFLEYMFKPMLMPLLGLFYMANAKRDYGTIGTLLLSALSFSWLGDCFLMYAPVYEPLFLAGMGAFLVAHLCYIALFLWPRREGQTHLLKKAPYLALPFALYGGSLLWMLLPKLGSFLWPIVGYSSVLLLMGIFALNRYGRVSSNSFLWVFVGALLFIISDSFIAINKFYQPIPWASFWIMSTYVLAQYLIVRGILIMQRQLG